MCLITLTLFVYLTVHKSKTILLLKQTRNKLIGIKIWIFHYSFYSNIRDFNTHDNNEGTIQTPTFNYTIKILKLPNGRAIYKIFSVYTLAH